MAESGGKADLRAVRDGARVMASDGPGGKVTEVLLGKTTDESYLRVRTAGLFGKDRYVAAYDVADVSDDTVWLKITRQTLAVTTARTRPHAFAHGA